MLVSLCRGRTLDVGLRPRSDDRAPAATGHAVLGIDVVPEAVRQARAAASGPSAPTSWPGAGDGDWDTVLLADGNIGIGGDPVRLLRRVGRLLTPGGRVVVDVATARCRAAACSEAAAAVGVAPSAPFAWSVLGADQAAPVAATAGLAHLETHEARGRWAVVLGAG